MELADVFHREGSNLIQPSSHLRLERCEFAGFSLRYRAGNLPVDEVEAACVLGTVHSSVSSAGVGGGQTGDWPPVEFKDRAIRAIRENGLTNLVRRIVQIDVIHVQPSSEYLEGEA